VEQLEATSMKSPGTRTISGKSGVIAATVSPVSVFAGLEALKRGGTAADAAATIALTQVTRQVGSVVSYAGILTAIYYDTKTDKVSWLDAGYNSYLNESNPATIPRSDLGAANIPGHKPTADVAKGRETLVPGFMAGIESLHKRYGRLRFADLFSPAIWYAENGVVLNKSIASYFSIRRGALSRTPEGRAFVRQGGDELPKPGDRFIQTELGKTLRAVAQDGARYIYAGPWAEHFVAAVQRDDGKATMDDMRRYRAVWNEPASTSFAGQTVFVPGDVSWAPYQIVPALHMIEALKLEQHRPYWEDPQVLRDVSRIADIVANGPMIDGRLATILDGSGVDVSREAQLKPAYAQAVASRLEEVYPAPADSPRHSNSIVVVDKEGNIAAMTHTIYTSIWGGTGIVVDGIPIPDSAGFQQSRLVAMNPGDRVPNEIVDSIVLNGDKKPVFAMGGIGSSIIPESIKFFLGIVGHGLDVATMEGAPPILSGSQHVQAGQLTFERPVVIPECSYSEEFLAGLKKLGPKTITVSTEDVAARRGTIAAVTIDPRTGLKTTAETAGALIFGGAY
jgi:gamma-glutamyltranspeptidase/glutathione hydrolase